ncbi:hypothetical protein SDC9_183843 [bioreactor metagenome]|uniref:Uncharacterized protein n=1 Tax=bioreactor metagenome TaxID=1076179 RepID=A0A645HJM1_9ZZZZ
MAQAAKIIGVHFKGKTYYALYLYIPAFSSAKAMEILIEQAHISMQRADKYLMLAPLANLAVGNELVFTNMPDHLEPREPYLLSFDFVKKRWQDIPEAAILDVDILVAKGPLLWEEPIANYLFT